MTREEAIQKIQNDLRLHHDDLSGDYRKALRIAIEALQQPEIVRCKDCEFTDGERPLADGRYWCILHSSFMYFCSDAERKKG